MNFLRRFNFYLLGLPSLVLGFVLLVVGTATNKWVENKHSQGEERLKWEIGLFKLELCYLPFCADTDTFLGYFPDDFSHTLKVIRVLCILGVTSSGTAILFSVLMIIKISKGARLIPDRNKIAVACAFLCFFAGVSTVIGVSMFDAVLFKKYLTKFYYGHHLHKGGSFICCVVGLVFIVLGGILLFFVKKNAYVYKALDPTQGHIYFHLQSTGHQSPFCEVAWDDHQQQHQQQMLQREQSQMQWQHLQHWGEQLHQCQGQESPWRHSQLNQNDRMGQHPAAPIRPPPYKSSAPSYQSSHSTVLSPPLYELLASTSPPPTSFIRPLPSPSQSPAPHNESVI